MKNIILLNKKRSNKKGEQLNRGFVIVMVIFLITFILIISFLNYSLMNKIFDFSKSEIESIKYNDELGMLKGVILKEFSIINDLTDESKIVDIKDYFLNNVNNERVYLDSNFEEENEFISKGGYKPEKSNYYLYIKEKLEEDLGLKYIEIKLEKELKLSNLSSGSTKNFKVVVIVKNKYGSNRDPKDFIEELIEEIQVKDEN